MCRELKSSVPCGVRGDYRVEKFWVDSQQAQISAIRALASGRGYVPSGEYTKLVKYDDIWMSDTPDECLDIAKNLREAYGVVRLNGLGLGLCAEYLLGRERVSKVIAVDISVEVIELVYPTLKRLYGEKIEVRNEDVLKVKPKKSERYDVVYHDIWRSICASNLDEMKFLTRRYATKAAFQSCWCRRECERVSRG